MLYDHAARECCQRRSKHALVNPCRSRQRAVVPWRPRLVDVHLHIRVALAVGTGIGWIKPARLVERCVRSRANVVSKRSVEILEYDVPYWARNHRNAAARI